MIPLEHWFVLFQLQVNWWLLWRPRRMKILGLLLALALGAGPAFGQHTINQLPLGAPLTGPEEVPMFQGTGPAVSTTPGAISTFMEGGNHNWSGRNFVKATTVAAGSSYTPATGGGSALLTLSQALTINCPSGAVANYAGQFALSFQQPSNANYPISFGAGCAWSFPGGSVPVATATNGALDQLDCNTFGTAGPIVCSFLPNVSSVPLSVDGSANNNSGSGVTSLAVVLTTTKANDIVDLFVSTNSSGVATVSSISSPNTSGWARRVQTIHSGQNILEEWSGKAASPLSSETITVNFGGSSSYTTIAAFGVNGANQTTVFDPNGALPNTSVTTGTDALITTTNANTVVVAGYNFGTTTTPTPGTGWTAIFGGNYMLVEYQIVSSIQSSLDAHIGTGAGDQTNAIGDAVTK